MTASTTTAQPPAESAWDITARLLRALRERYPTKHFRDHKVQSVFLEQVRNAAGFDASRTCDALHLEMWPSAGLRLTGFEIKATRGDWLRELKDPAKGEAFALHCDHWFVVAPVGVVDVSELPTGWGLLVPNVKGKLGIAHPSPKRRDPLPVSRGMLVAIVAATVAESLGPMLASVRVETEKALAKARQSSESDETRQLRRDVESFERESGVKLAAYQGGELGRRVRAALALGDAVRAMGELQWARQTLQHALTRCDEALAEAAKPPLPPVERSDNDDA